MLKIIIRSIFSLNLLTTLVESFSYYLFEHVYWKFSINKKKRCRIHPTSSIRNAHNIYIGNNSHINLNCVLWAGKVSTITIGDNLLMGPGVQIHASNHGYALNKGPMTFQSRKDKNISIGNDIWIGSNSIITAGVTIADGIIIRAGSVVTKNFKEKNIIIGGSPAKKIISRR